MKDPIYIIDPKEVIDGILRMDQYEVLSYNSDIHFQCEPHICNSCNACYLSYIYQYIIVTGQKYE